MEENYRSGKLVAIKRLQKRSTHQRAKWLCRCDCGNEKIALEDAIRSRKTQSCGCIKAPKGEEYHRVMKERISERIKIDENGCWNFRLTNHGGYGRIWFNRRDHVVHRVTWMLYKGEIPKGLLVLHKCDNPTCCNPEHLFLGTQKENIKDCIEKGRKVFTMPPQDNPRGKKGRFIPKEKFYGTF